MGSISTNILNYSFYLPYVLMALAYPNRLAMAREINEKGEVQSQHFESVNIAPGSIDFHQNYLLGSGVIEARFQDGHRFFHIRRRELEAAFPGLLDAILLSPIEASEGE